MRDPYDTGKYIKAAHELRLKIAELFVAEPAERIVLAPGMLVGLHVLFASLQVERLMLTTEEYYRPGHFPACKTKTVKPEQIVSQAKQFRPNAIIISLVTWKGRPLPVTQLFRQLRAELGPRGPLLIVDYAHAGAFGFPRISEIGADIVCGDLYKWITSPKNYGNIGFLWFRTKSLWRRAVKAFSPFFLAVDNDANINARWLNTKEIETILSWIKESKLNRKTLLQRYGDNMLLTQELAERLNLPVPQSSILWLHNIDGKNPIIKVLEHHGLAWEPSTGGIRLQCRADLLNAEELNEYLSCRAASK